MNMKIKKILTAALLAAGVAFQANATDIPRKEYPRPQFERASWVNLNGEWDYTFDFSGSGLERGLEKATSFDKKIVVPFCPESSLSGVEYKDFINHIWYHRELTIPQEWNDKNILLNFGAVYFNSENRTCSLPLMAVIIPVPLVFGKRYGWKRLLLPV